MTFEDFGERPRRLSRSLLLLIVGLPWVGAPFHLAHTHLRESVFATAALGAALAVALFWAVANVGASRARRGPEDGKEEPGTTHERSTSADLEERRAPNAGDLAAGSPGVLRSDAPLPWIALLAGVGLLSTTWSATPRSTWLAATPWLATTVVAFLLRISGASWESRRFGSAAALSGAVLALAGLASWLVPFGSIGGIEGCGPFGGTTTAASAAALLLPVASHTILVACTTRGRAGASAAAALLALWLFSLGVRAAWIAGAAGMIVVVWSARSSAWKRRVVVGSLALAGAAWLCPLALFPAGGPAGGNRTARAELLAALDLRRDSSGERLTLWRNGLELVASAPALGQGLGRLRDVYPLSQEHGAPHNYTSLDVHRSPHHIHFDALEIWVELGPLGLALWIAAALAAWRGTARAPASRAVLLVFGVLGIFHTSLFDPTALALLAPALAASAVSGAAARGPAAPRSWKPSGCGAAITLCLALGVVGSWARVAADRHHDAAMRALALERVEAAPAAAALAHARRAAALDPEDTEKLLGLAAWLRRTGAPEAALLPIGVAATTGPGSLARRGLEAEVLYDLGRREAAEACLAELLMLQPQNREAHLALARWAELSDGGGAGWPTLERLTRAIPWLDDPRLWLRIGEERLRAHTSFGARRHLAAAEDALQRALAVTGLAPEESGRAISSLIEARLRMRGRPAPIEGLDARLREIWPRINPGEIRTDLLGRLRVLSATTRSEGRAELARRLDLLVLDLNAR